MKHLTKLYDKYMYKNKYMYKIVNLIDKEVNKWGKFYNLGLSIFVNLIIEFIERQNVIKY